jgi:hypothetical protein
MNVISAIEAAFATLGSPYALIGGRAVGIRGFPRMTLDYDFLTADQRVLDSSVWESLAATFKASVDVRKGDFDDPIAGVVHIAFPDGSEADILLAKWKWESEVIARAELLEVAGTRVLVPVTSDLVLLKLVAGGPIDLQDVISLIATDRDRWVAEVDRRVGEVRPDVTESWARLKQSL